MRWIKLFFYGEVDVPDWVFYLLTVLIFVLAAIALVYGDRQVQWWLKEVMKK